MIHRRFGGWLEFDRNGPPLSGTKEQQAAVRAAVNDHRLYGNRFWQTMHAIDIEVNLLGRSFIPVGFYPLHEADLLGFCWPNYIQLGELLVPDEVGDVFLHEVGHMVAWKLRAWSNKSHEGSEDRANEFRDWVTSGQPDGPVWDRIKPRL